MSRALIALAFIAFSASGQTLPNVQLMDMGDSEGVRRVYSTPEVNLLKTPDWNPEKDGPPLPIAKAIVAGRDWVMKKHPKFDGVRLRDIHLQEAQCYSSGRARRWFYTLSFDPTVDGHAFWGSGINVVILMNGEVIEPVEKKGE